MEKLLWTEPVANADERSEQVDKAKVAKCPVETVENGQQALQRVAQTGSKQRPCSANGRELP